MDKEYIKIRESYDNNVENYAKNGGILLLDNLNSFISLSCRCMLKFALRYAIFEVSSNDISVFISSKLFITVLCGCFILFI